MRQELIDQYEDTSIAILPTHPGTSIANARAQLRSAASHIGAKVRTRSAEHQKYQGVRLVVGEIVHGPVDGRGCYICRKTGERLGRIMFRYEFDSPETSCKGSLIRILNDDPEDFQTEVYARHLANAGVAAWLVSRKDVA